MELLKEYVGKSTEHILFLDIEGTQLKHEVIAIGAVLCDVNEDLVPTGKKSTFKCYVKPNSKVGNLVTMITGIDEETVAIEGINFVEAMHKLSVFLGNKTRNLKVLTYGNQDKVMLKNSFRVFNDHSQFITSFMAFIERNVVDISPFFARYINGNKANLISLINLRKFFKLEPAGQSHDPLVDSLDLYNIYEAVSRDPSLIVESYKEMLLNTDRLPLPVKKLIIALYRGDTVTKEDFLNNISEYFR